MEVNNFFPKIFSTGKGSLLTENPKLDVYLAKWFQKLNHLIGSIVDRTNVNRTCTGYDEPVNEDYFEVLHQAFIHTDQEFYVFDLYNSILDQAFLNCTKISQDRLKYITIFV